MDGGVEIWGTQRFVSGCNFAEWIMSPVLLDGEMHNAVIAIRDCEVQDNWDTWGMRGSGSNDVLLDHVKVLRYRLSASAARLAGKSLLPRRSVPVSVAYRFCNLCACRTELGQARH